MRKVGDRVIRVHRHSRHPRHLFWRKLMRWLRGKLRIKIK